MVEDICVNSVFSNKWASNSVIPTMFRVGKMMQCKQLEQVMYYSLPYAES